MKRVHPLTDIGPLLNSVHNPARYLGGEFGQAVKSEADFTFAIAFPDVYEIAMSNQAVKIIYGGLNRIPSVRCERVFAPEPDFEHLLREKSLPLYTLESGIPLHCTDIVGFSIGYELGINGALSILESGFVPILRIDRSENDPIVMAGGCGVTNPAPFADFFDAVFIGEAEPELFSLTEDLSRMKRDGAGRADLLERMSLHPSVWMPDRRGKKTVKAVYGQFGRNSVPVNCFPVPSLRVVQDHGVVEIMRGCPNGCRFCHAGIYYRPQRIKPVSRIIDEVEQLVSQGGYREISLTSLSSGDYEDTGRLLDMLTRRFSRRHVSFQLPSLKVNTFTLPVIEKLAEVRKSGLTFAVETPVEAWQFSVNKEVYRQRVIDIIAEAKKRGWNKAKFYFMIGLPVRADGLKEEEEIVSFMLDVQETSRIQCSVNVGTFIPKAHTPYQWAPQLSVTEAERKLLYIRQNLPRGQFRVSTHKEFNSFLEGMLSRGDERVGRIVFNAYRKGCRLDAWEDHMRSDLWKEAVAEAGWDVEREITRERRTDEKLPWDDISLGPSKQFYLREYERSAGCLLTPPCSEQCTERCGVCRPATADGEDIKVHNRGAFTVSDVVYKKIHKTQQKKGFIYKNSYNIYKNIQNELKNIHDDNFYIKEEQNQNIELMWRAVFSFSKTDGAEFLPHLGLVETFAKAFQRSGLPVIYTAGFNPQPRLELASSLAVGISSLDEIASCLLRHETAGNTFAGILNRCLPESVRVGRVFIFPVTRKIKRESLASLLWGSEYVYRFARTEHTDFSALYKFFDETLSACGGSAGQPSAAENGARSWIEFTVIVPFGKEKMLRTAVENLYGRPLYEIASVEKKKTFAVFSAAGNGRASYFDLYESIAANHAAVISQEVKLLKT